MVVTWHPGHMVVALKVTAAAASPQRKSGKGWGGWGRGAPCIGPAGTRPQPLPNGRHRGPVFDQLVNLTSQLLVLT